MSLIIWPLNPYQSIEKINAMVIFFFYLLFTFLAWSQQHMVIHLGGTFCDFDDSKHYYLYPDVISESTNTILTQIVLTMNYTLTHCPEKTRINFVFDNHSTQKNFTVICIIFSNY